MSGKSKRGWQFKALLDSLFVGGRTWGVLRLLMVILITIIFTSFSWRFYVGKWGISPPLLSLNGLRFWVMPVAALFGALLAGATYVKDVYEIPQLRHAIRYLQAAAFAVFQPSLTVKEGKTRAEDAAFNLLESVGGPGYVNVTPGSVVLLERLNAPSNVYGEGENYVTRQERIKQIASLDDQHAQIEKVPATTKDGIPIIVRAVQYRYRLRTGRQLGDYTVRVPEKPYPFSIQAMRNLTYNPAVAKEGQTSWHVSVRSTISAVITDYIHKHNIDYITAPVKDTVQEPRAEIKELLFSRITREQLRKVGAELLWVDIGHFDIAVEDVDNQRVSTWQASWAGKANIERAYGEAQRAAYEELGRAEAQAEILMSILHSLSDAVLTHEASNELRQVILNRTAEFVVSVSEQGGGTPNELPASPEEDPHTE